MNEMTEREFILKVLERIGQKVLYQSDEHIEVDNGYGYETLIIDFDKDGNITTIGA